MNLMGIDGPVCLVLDRTTWQFGKLDINLLVLAVVVTHRFSLPVFVKALPKKGSSNSQERIDLLKLFLNLFPSSRIACVIADREFIGKAWIDFLITHNVPFFIRVKANRLVDYGGKMIAIGAFFHHLKKGEKRFLEKTLDGHHCYFAATRSQKGELVIVMSNQDERFKALTIYRNRWTLETLFHHAKENGFNLEDTHLIHCERIEKLFLIMAVALALSYRFGCQEEQQEKTPFKKTVAAPLFSTFRRGFDALRRLLIHSFLLALNAIASYFKQALLKSVG